MFMPTLSELYREERGAMNDRETGTGCHSGRHALHSLKKACEMAFGKAA